MISFEIERRPLSTNQVMRMHYRVRKREKEMLAWALRMASLVYHVPLNVERRRRVHITLFLPRRFDHDNAVGGQKILLDAMRAVGMIKNDSEKWLDLVVDQELSKERKIRIIIDEEEPCRQESLPQRVGGLSKASRRTTRRKNPGSITSRGS